MTALTHPRELIEGILPETETSILAGASGVGKTTLLMQVLRCLQRNEPVFGHQPQQDIAIGYIAADRTWQAYARLAEQVGVDLAKIKIRALVDDDDIDCTHFERDPQSIMYSLLKEFVKSGVRLAVVDPLVVFLGCDTRLYHVNAARLIRLNKFCRQNNITVLGTHHATKARTDFTFKRAQDRISGTSALLGFTSTQLFMAAPDECGGEFTEWHIVSHHAPGTVLYLKRNDHGLFEAVDPNDAVKVAEALTPMQTEIAKGILHHLTPDGTPVSRKELVDALKYHSSPRAVDEQLQRLRKSGAILGFAGGFYALPPVVNLGARD